MLDIVERGPDPAARQSGQVRHRPDRFERAQNVSRSFLVKRIRVEEIRAAEHVEHGRPRRRQIGVGPAADTRKLALLELAERAVEEPRMALPRRVLRQRRQGRARRRRHPGEEPRGIVGGTGVGGTRGKRDREEHGCGERRNFEGLKHRYSRLGDAATALRSVRLRKTA